jgi:hypothetical protein
MQTPAMRRGEPEKRIKWEDATAIVTESLVWQLEEKMEAYHLPMHYYKYYYYYVIIIIIIMYYYY